jgi:hypothetical protein
MPRNSNGQQAVLKNSDCDCVDQDFGGRSSWKAILGVLQTEEGNFAISGDDKGINTQGFSIKQGISWFAETAKDPAWQTSNVPIDVFP